MITFVLEPADGEQDFKANAWSNRGRYSFSGSWSKGENDAIQIKFQMSFTNTFWSVFFNGHFDPDRDALTGVWGMSADPDNSFGPMEFRRIQPRYLTVYPSFKELSDNKPRSLWRFAIAAVRNDIRRDRWSWSHFSQRRDDRKMYISLILRSFFGTPLDEQEFQQVCAAALRLTPADACFYNSQIKHIRAHTLIHKWVFARDTCWFPMLTQSAEMHIVIHVLAVSAVLGCCVLIVRTTTQDLTMLWIFAAHRNVSPRA
jgi:hypothetical protein